MVVAINVDTLVENTVNEECVCVCLIVVADWLNGAVVVLLDSVLLTKIVES